MVWKALTFDYLLTTHIRCISYYNAHKTSTKFLSFHDYRNRGNLIHAKVMALNVLMLRIQTGYV